MTTTQPAPLAFAVHDHRQCRTATLVAVEQACADQGLRLTAARRRVLEILLEEHRALGAYDVLRRLTAEGATPQPPVAYRALDFLVEHGFAHRIERLNAYVACAAPAGQHPAAFLICRRCRAVAEVDAATAALALGATANSAGFAADHAMLEVEGLCPTCQACTEA